MLKAYSIIPDLNKKAKEILEKNNIELILNDAGDIPSSEECITLLENYDILIIGVKTKISKEILKSIKTPKIIATLSIGLDHIDKEVRQSKEIHVINIKDANTISVAEHIFSLILALQKRIYESNALVLNKKGNKKNLHERPEDITGKTLGLIGAGNITKEVIKIAQVFHMPMICYTKNPEKHQDLLNMGIVFKSLEEVLKESDIISVSIPLNDETKHLISKEKIELIKPTATFINTSRVNVVDMYALLEKSDKNPSFCVGLDIDTEEYEALISTYRRNVIVTPHTAGVSKQAIDRMDVELAEKIINEAKERIRKC